MTEHTHYRLIMKLMMSDAHFAIFKAKVDDLIPNLKNKIGRGNEDSTINVLHDTPSIGQKTIETDVFLLKLHPSVIELWLWMKPRLGNLIVGSRISIHECNHGNDNHAGKCIERIRYENATIEKEETLT